jgi:hypothetical protein
VREAPRPAAAAPRAGEIGPDRQQVVVPCAAVPGRDLDTRQVGGEEEHPPASAGQLDEVIHLAADVVGRPERQRPGDAQVGEEKKLLAEGTLEASP